jgi:hypothetical protein
MRPRVLSIRATTFCEGTVDLDVADLKLHPRQRNLAVGQHTHVIS